MSPGWVYPEKEQPRGPMRLLDLLWPAIEPAGHWLPATPDTGQEAIDMIMNCSTSSVMKRGSLA